MLAHAQLHCHTLACVGPRYVTPYFWFISHCSSDLFYAQESLPRLLSSMRWLCKPEQTWVLAGFELRQGVQEMAKLLPFYGLRAHQVHSCRTGHQMGTREYLSV